MYDIFYNLFEIIFTPIITFLNGVLLEYGAGGQLGSYNFKIGFGSIEWFMMDLETLFVLIGGSIISIVFIILIFKVFKFFTKLVKTSFGGRKW